MVLRRNALFCCLPTFFVLEEVCLTGVKSWEKLSFLRRMINFFPTKSIVIQPLLAVQHLLYRQIHRAHLNNFQNHSFQPDQWNWILTWFYSAKIRPENATLCLKAKQTYISRFIGWRSFTSIGWRSFISIRWRSLTICWIWSTFLRFSVASLSFGNGQYLRRINCRSKSSLQTR